MVQSSDSDFRAQIPEHQALLTDDSWNIYYARVSLI